MGSTWAPCDSQGWTWNRLLDTFAALSSVMRCGREIKLHHTRLHCLFVPNPRNVCTQQSVLERPIAMNVELLCSGPWLAARMSVKTAGNTEHIWKK
jgi:hypothetical protein